MTNLKKNGARNEIARKIRALREARNWTQAELSRRLGLSQGRFSQVERGQGSFTAEQFLEILKLFNVPLSHFATWQAGPGAGIQNALARLGAADLPERPDVLPSERLVEAGDVVREALLDAESSRHITSLAPVLVRNIEQINLNRLRAQFLEYGLERRLAWLLENTLAAVRHTLSEAPPGRGEARCQRAELILGAHLEKLSSAPFQTNADGALDLLDTWISSEESLNDVQASRSAISLRWGMVTTLQPGDFTVALKASAAAEVGSPGKAGSGPRRAATRKLPVPKPPSAESAASDKAPEGTEGRRTSNPVEMDWD